MHFSQTPPQITLFQEVESVCKKYLNWEWLKQCYVEISGQIIYFVFEKMCISNCGWSLQIYKVARKIMKVIIVVRSMPFKKRPILEIELTSWKGRDSKQPVSLWPEWQQRKNNNEDL